MFPDLAAEALKEVLVLVEQVEDPVFSGKVKRKRVL